MRTAGRVGELSRLRVDAQVVVQRGEYLLEVDRPLLGAQGVAAARRNGRGAQTNRSGRFEPTAYEPVDDGWESLAELEARVAALEAQLGAAEPFIEEELRPDLLSGLLGEEEATEGELGDKRSYDSKPPEA